MSEELNENHTEEIPTETQKDKVSYDSYKKLLNQHKEAQKKLQDFQKQFEDVQTKLKVKEDEELKEQNKWREMWERSKEENKKLQDNLNYSQKRFENAIKQRAFIDQLGFQIKDKYLSFVDLENIDLMENGSVD